jgi:HTH-type transcriptional regulator / antitoxin HipB
MNYTPLRSAEHLGLLVRLERKRKGLSQRELAGLVGVERKWILRFEAGNSRAEIGSVLKTLQRLGLRVSIGDKPPAGEESPRKKSRLDEVFLRLQQRARS